MMLGYRPDSASGLAKLSKSQPIINFDIHSKILSQSENFCRTLPYKAVEFGAYIAAIKLRATEDAGNLAALPRSQAVIELTLESEIVTANENFLSAPGSNLGEIAGGQFCDTG